VRGPPAVAGPVASAADGARAAVRVARLTRSRADVGAPDTGERYGNGRSGYPFRARPCELPG
ncbi:hypothetical protein, partial [Cryobacterium frigoriphilum]|uniref:hypothetical protein n=1 Tax=Cryobacterium frigoriphilum TaxID=1259150 RepID=UPI00141B7DA4